MKVKSLAQLFLCCSACLLFIWQVEAKNLGVYGKTFAIEEPDLLQVIETKLSQAKESGKLKTLQDTWQQQAQQSVERPAPVHGIHHTEKARTFFYDPSVIVPEDLKDHQGRIFQKSGTRINPLKIRPFTQILLFLDGDDKKQLQWALRQTSAHKNKMLLILVNGTPFQLMEQTKQRFYFDQQGQLVKQLGIQQVPARVMQVDMRLKIEEVVL